MNDSCLTTLDRAYANQRGGSCSIPNPYVSIRFKKLSLAYISKIEVQRDVPGLPSGNVRQIEALFYNEKGSIITNEITGQPVGWTSPQDNPTINGYFPDVSGVILKILRTDNNAGVQRLRVKITGCYSLGRTTVVELHCNVILSSSLSTNVYHSTNYTKFM